MQLGPYASIKVLVLNLTSPTRENIPKSPGHVHVHGLFKFSDAVHALELNKHHDRNIFSIPSFNFHFEVLFNSFILKLLNFVVKAYAVS